jgi:hypothetical protein
VETPNKATASPNGKTKPVKSTVKSTPVKPAPTTPSKNYEYELNSIFLDYYTTLIIHSDMKSIIRSLAENLQTENAKNDSLEQQLFEKEGKEVVKY